jgi:hypothetical protein
MLDTNTPLPTRADAKTPDAIIPHQVNSVDATMGQPIVARVMARKLELETILAAMPESNLLARSNIELALGTINVLLTGDLTKVPAVVVADMSKWLEHNKHLAESAVDPSIAPVAVIDAVTAPVAALETKPS